MIWIGLLTISILLSWEAFAKYKSRDTNLKQSHEEVESYPSITICFDPIDDKLEYNQDFQLIAYGNLQDFLMDKSGKGNFLFEGKNPKSGITVTKIVTVYYGICYKINPYKKIVKKSDKLTISIKFNESMKQSIKIPSAVIYITSPANAMGIAGAYWYEGRLYRKNVPLNEGTSFGLLGLEYNYLQEKSGCSKNQSWYDCFGYMVETLIFDNCSSKCLSYSIRDGTQNLEYCKPKTSAWKCSNSYMSQLRELIINDNKCPRSCKIRQYEIEKKDFSFKHSNTIAFQVYFRPPYINIVYTEYLLFDFLGLVSSVGGTMGIFIGISIIAVISKCFSCILSIHERLFSKIGSSSNINNI